MATLMADTDMHMDTITEGMGIAMEDTDTVMEDMDTAMEDTDTATEDTDTATEVKGSQQKRKEKSSARSFTLTGMTTKMNTGMGTPAAVHPLSGLMQ